MPETARVLCFQTYKARLEEQRADDRRDDVEAPPPVLPFPAPLDARQVAHRRAMLVHLERA